MIIELLLLAAFGVATAGGIGVIVRKGVTSRKFNSKLGLPAPEPQRMVLGPPQQLMLEAPRAEIPEDIRRELDESYEMSRDKWDAEFHASLNASSAREVLAIRSNYSYDGDNLPDHTLLKDCTCADCTGA
ncbi:membrane protein [Microbacterium phage Zooman]|nr:membrane protein [Microbacterium phage Zooman]